MDRMANALPGAQLKEAVHEGLITDVEISRLMLPALKPHTITVINAAPNGNFVTERRDVLKLCIGRVTELFIIVM